MSRTRRGEWSLTLRGKRKRRYRVQASLATMRRPFEPCSVTVGGRPVRFHYSRRLSVLRVTFAARRATATVRAC